MARQPDVTGNLEAALAAAEAGLAAIPCRPGTKVPTVKWKEWQGKVPPADLLGRWFAGTRNNVALVTTGLVVFDCDDAAKAELVLAECGETSHKLKTPRGGVHLGYRRRKGVEVKNLVKIKGQPIDIRTDGGLELIPPSVTSDGAYEWLSEGLKPISDLPLAKVAWTRERKRRRVRTLLAGPQVLPTGQGRIRNPEAYCLRVESVQGQNGSRGLVRVVCVMRDAGRTPQQAFDFILGPWNAACARPTWSEGEVLHAINRHYGTA